MQTRIYVVHYRDGSKPNRLVRASSQGQAIKYVVDSVYSAKAAGAGDVAECMSQGIQVEDATAKVKSATEEASDESEA